MTKRMPISYKFLVLDGNGLVLLHLVVLSGSITFLVVLLLYWENKKEIQRDKDLPQLMRPSFIKTIMANTKRRMTLIESVSLEESCEKKLYIFIKMNFITHWSNEPTKNRPLTDV